MSNSCGELNPQPKSIGMFGDASHDKKNHTAACPDGCIPTDGRAGELLSFIQDARKDKVVDDHGLKSHQIILLPDAYKEPAFVEDTNFNAALVVSQILDMYWVKC